MWPRQINGAYSEGDGAPSVVLPLAHGSSLPDFIAQAVPLILPWGLGDLPFDKILELSWHGGLCYNYFWLGRRWYGYAVWLSCHAQLFIQ